MTTIKKYPSTASGTFSYPDNIKADDDVYASGGGIGGANDYLIASDFAFNIPGNAIINSITYKALARRSKALYSGGIKIILQYYDGSLWVNRSYIADASLCYGDDWENVSETVENSSGVFTPNLINNKYIRVYAELYNTDYEHNSVCVDYITVTLDYEVNNTFIGFNF